MMKKFLGISILLAISFIIVACGASGNEKSNKNESTNTEKQTSKEAQVNTLYGELTITSEKVNGSFYDSENRTKYIIDSEGNIKKIIDKSNKEQSPKKFMQNDAQKTKNISENVNKYHSKSLNKDYKVIQKKDVLIVVPYK
ncbi:MULTISPECIES: hypothetical protein [Staphylococcus]|uniref:Lipoprotein n=1 Tax=Staphylococcus equorum TaxID=246432 RepID=A0A9X4L7Y5_9STAP|nr:MULTISPECIES: hypothetical protein [Staphylococcus]KRG09901.1 hypothetical protein ACA31_03220 [Staphylococcus sp. NAM3COL9]MDG0843354.1 hypothetical protein [Staphylococcus equorum]MDG0858665.1 hypothetical protein [Staphylococcus equorum]